MADDSRFVIAVKEMREALALARDVVIVVAVAILILAPQWTVPTFQSIGRALSQAGFTKVSIAGLEQDLERYREDVQDARLNTQLAGETIKEVSQRLANNASIPSDTREQLARAGALVGQTSETLAIAEQRVERTAQAAIGAGPPDSWAAVIGADRELGSAQDEVIRAAKAGFPGAFIVRRDGWYRTVIPMPSREIAEARLPEISRLIRSGAYVRNLGQWCPPADNRGDKPFRNCPT